MTNNGTLAERASVYLTEHGYSITDTSLYHGLNIDATCSHPDWFEGPLVVGSRKTLSAGRLVAAAAVAETEKRYVTVVTPTAADAHWVGDVLSDPVASGPTDGWTTLYSIDGRYWRDDSTLYLAPQWKLPGIWQLATDGRLRYRIGDQTMAIGQIDQPLSTFETGLGKFRLKDGCFWLYRSDGTLVGRTNDPAKLTRWFRPVERPAIPTRLQYGPTSTILYADGEGLQPARPLTEKTAQPTTDTQWQTHIWNFLRQYTVPADDSIALAALYREIRWWARLQFHTAVPDDYSLRQQIKASLRSLESDQTRSGHPTPTVSGETLQGRSWRHPRCTVPAIEQLSSLDPTGPLVELAETLSQTEDYDDNEIDTN